MITKLMYLRDLKKELNEMTEDQLVQPIKIEYGDMQPNINIRQLVVTDEDWYMSIDDYEDCGNLATLQEVHGESLNLDNYTVITPKGMIYLTD